MIMLANIFATFVAGGCFFVELNYKQRPGWLWLFGILVVVNLGFSALGLEKLLR